MLDDRSRNFSANIGLCGNVRASLSSISNQRPRNRCANGCSAMRWKPLCAYRLGGERRVPHDLWREAATGENMGKERATARILGEQGTSGKRGQRGEVRHKMGAFAFDGLRRCCDPGTLDRPPAPHSALVRTSALDPTRARAAKSLVSLSCLNRLSSCPFASALGGTNNPTSHNFDVA